LKVISAKAAYLQQTT